MIGVQESLITLTVEAIYSSPMSTPIVSAPSEEVAALHAQVRHYESELTERDVVIAKHEAMIAHLQEQVRFLLVRRFTPSSEKIPG